MKQSPGLPRCAATLGNLPNYDNPNRGWVSFSGAEFGECGSTLPDDRGVRFTILTQPRWGCALF